MTVEKFLAVWREESGPHSRMPELNWKLRAADGRSWTFDMAWPDSNVVVKLLGRQINARKLAECLRDAAVAGMRPICFSVSDDVTEAAKYVKREVCQGWAEPSERPEIKPVTTYYPGRG